MLLFFMVLLLWSVLLIVLLIFWARQKNEFKLVDRPCSVIIPFRNEEATLAKLVKALSGQSAQSAEFIFVNDHSEDGSLEVLYRALEKYSLKARVLELKESEGKKAALSLGVSEASNEIIITTDADCTVEANWLKAMLAPFANKRVQMVLGPVMLSGASLWQQMQSIEFSTLIGVTGVTAKWGSPVMANGANLAYRKSAFEQVNGFEGIDSAPSGDDELLVNKIQKEFGKSAVFNSSPDALVKTAAFESWKDFKNQRLRWVSKWKEGFRPMTMLTAIYIFLVQLSQLGIIGLAFIKADAVLMVLVLLPIKFIAELLFIASVRSLYKLKTPIHYFLLCFILYPFYAIYFGIAANFKKFEWKGRKYPASAR